MVFSSSVFLLLFLPIVFMANYIMKNNFSNILLLIASLFFYAWGEPVLVLLMIFTIITNWLLGRIMIKQVGRYRKIMLALAVVLDLSILGYYKYAGFFISILNSVMNNDVIQDPGIKLPIGISFFTFQAISYVIDVYRGDVEESPKLINMALYISFFPQLIAGPIVKYKEINKQLENREITFDGITLGFKRFIYGLGKKVLISNVMGLCVDTIYSFDTDIINSKAAWIAALAYTFQIYYDFSGYSDMAIGLGKMFGFIIPENFNYPYLSKSISEFWRRWHISLGTWFKEYLYIPLGGNRKGTVRTYMNLGIVFLLTGLWHGAAFTYILWGLYHGAFQVIERLGLEKILKKNKVIASCYCLVIVNFGWVFFRAESVLEAIRYLLRMLMPWKYITGISVLRYMDNKTICVGICAILGVGVLKKVPQNIKDRWNNSIVEAIYCTCVLTLCIASIASNTYNPFIYFQF
ncbi:MAG: MBOAT family protein [Lachnospiraceae bacterium]|nr:MBOAT family protein [Lachnospiraceae bacterium]